jgi:hypothetical protein
MTESDRMAMLDKAYAAGYETAFQGMPSGYSHRINAHSFGYEVTE